MATWTSPQFDVIEHRYTVDGRVVPSVTQILKAVGLIDYSFIPQAVLLEAARRGRLVHQALEYMDRDELDEESVDPQLAGYITACRRFYRESGFVVADIEKRVYNRLYGYAGTLDRTGFLERTPAVLDLKTGLVLPGHALQLVGYANCLPQPRRFRRIALQLNDDGTYRVHEYPAADFERDTRAFLSAVCCVVWRMNADKEFRVWRQ